MLGTAMNMVIVTLGIVSFGCMISLILTAFDYKYASDERKADCKSDLKTLVIALSCLMIALTGCIVGASFYFKKEKLYEYKDVTSVAETVETFYEVRIDRVISEKERESVYYITLFNNKMVGETPDVP